MEIVFTVPAVPIAQPRQRHRIIAAGGKTFASNYTPSKHPVQDFKASCRMAAAAAYKGPPLDCPIRMDLVFVFDRPATVPKRLGTGRLPHTGKPDRDNVMKSLQDSLEGLLFRNDSLIYDGTVQKFKRSVDEQPHVEVRITVEDAE